MSDEMRSPTDAEIWSYGHRGRVEWPDQDTRDMDLTMFAREVERLRRAPQAGEAEAVAWRYKLPEWNYWKTTAIKPINGNMVIEPLYARSVGAVEVTWDWVNDAKAFIEKTQALARALVKAGAYGQIGVLYTQANSLTHQANALLSALSPRPESKGDYGALAVRLLKHANDIDGYM